MDSDKKVVSSSQPEQPVVQESPTKKPNIWMVVAIIFCTLFLGLVGYVVMNQFQSRKSVQTPTPTPKSVSPTLNETANWKTYTNSELPISLQYPSSWIVTPIVDEGKIVGADVKGSEGLLHMLWGSGFGGGCDVQYHQLIQFQGGQFDSCHTFDTSGNEVWNNLSKQLSNTSFSATATAYKPTTENREIVLKILSTVKFTGQVQTLDTSTWKTYSNEKYNYSFKFPQTWNQGGNDEATLLYDKPIIGNEMGYPVEIYPAVLAQTNVQGEDPIGTKKEVGDKIFEEKIADLTIDNRSAAKFRITVLEGSQTDARPAILVRVKNKNQIFNIKFYGNSQELEIYDQILSTFKFTN